MLLLKLVIETAFFCLMMVGVLKFMIRDGAIHAVHFYPKKIQDRVIELGLITPGEIKANSVHFRMICIPLYIVISCIFVYGVNAAETFLSAFLEMLFIFEVFNLFDCLVIDETWVRKDKAWLIPGTEDLYDDYLPLDLQIRKRVSAGIFFALIAAVIALIGSLF